MGTGGVYVWLEYGVKRSVLCWYFLQAFGREDVFSLHLIYFLRNLLSMKSECELQR
jgi:hypothetical protein